MIYFTNGFDVVADGFDVMVLMGLMWWRVFMVVGMGDWWWWWLMWVCGAMVVVGTMVANADLFNYFLMGLSPGLWVVAEVDEASKVWLWQRWVLCKFWLDFFFFLGHLLDSDFAIGLIWFWDGFFLWVHGGVGGCRGDGGGVAMGFEAEVSGVVVGWCRGHGVRWLRFLRLPWWRWLWFSTLGTEFWR